MASAAEGLAQTNTTRSTLICTIANCKWGENRKKYQLIESVAVFKTKKNVYFLAKAYANSQRKSDYFAPDDRFSFFCMCVCVNLLFCCCCAAVGLCIMRSSTNSPMGNVHTSICSVHSSAQRLGEEKRCNLKIKMILRTR